MYSLSKLLNGRLHLVGSTSHVLPRYNICFFMHDNYLLHIKGKNIYRQNWFPININTGIYVSAMFKT